MDRAEAPGSDEAELVAAALRGSAAAFAEITSRNNKQLFRVAFAILRDDEDAEEAVQEAYIHAFTSLASFRAEARLTTWLVTIVRNEALARLRRRHGTAVPADQAELERAGLDEACSDPERDAARHETRLRIDTALSVLPDGFRQVFLLRAAEQLSVRETALRLAIAEETVRTRYHRAKQLLRDGLGEESYILLWDSFPFAGARCRRVTAAVLNELAGGAAPTVS